MKLLKSFLYLDALKLELSSRRNLNSLDQSKKLSWLLLLISSFTLTSCMFRLSTSTGVIDSPQATNEAKFYIQAMTKGQQAYYLMHGELASSIEKLSIGIDLETESYRYQLIKGGQEQNVVMTASAKTPELPSYTGVVYLNQDTSGVTAIANICQTDKPSTEPPKISITPNPDESSLDCPSGSHKVQ
jgi:hypothetical protein